MRKTGLFILLWLIVACGTLCRAQTAPKFIRSCPPSALDVYALPPTTAGTNHDAHLLVLELKNIGPTACTLSDRIIQMMPRVDENNQFYGGVPGEEMDQREKEYRDRGIGPGQWVHLLVAWISRSAPEVECDEYSSLRLVTGPNLAQSLTQTTVEIRNLRMRSCAPAYVSGYRAGRYTAESKPPKSWSEWWRPATPGDLTFSAISTSQLVRDSSLLQLHAPAKRMMLGDGLAQLRLKFFRQADNGCPFRILRKRESTGMTVISIQQCTDEVMEAPEPVPAHLESGVLRLPLYNLDFFPQHAGALQYDVIGNTGSPAFPQFALAHLNLIVRDATPPAQAAVSHPLPNCRGDQLRLSAVHQLPSGRLQSLRAYEAINRSSDPCSLAGVPALRFFDGEGKLLVSFPKVCPNCDNAMFAPRPNGRLDLTAGEKAHFLVGGTSIDRQEDPWMLDLQLEAIEVTPSPGDTSVKLPFRGGAGAALDVSAWRAGAFDDDPMNKVWAQRHAAAITIPATPVPSRCTAEDPELGQPVMLIQKLEGLGIGVSLPERSFPAGQPVKLGLWIDNSADQQKSLQGCGALQSFLNQAFDLYDAYGHRLLRRREVEVQEMCKTDPHAADRLFLWKCTLNNPVIIAADSCSGHDYDLGAEYDLPPGEYTLRERDVAQNDDICAPVSQKSMESVSRRLGTFEVTQP